MLEHIKHPITAYEKGRKERKQRPLYPEKNWKTLKISKGYLDTEHTKQLGKRATGKKRSLYRETEPERTM